MVLRFRYKSGYRKTEHSNRPEGSKPIWSMIAEMCNEQHYWNHECIIDQGVVKLKNESESSWEKYILDFLFYKRRKEAQRFMGIDYCIIIKSTLPLYAIRRLAERREGAGG